MTTGGIGDLRRNRPAPRRAHPFRPPAVQKQMLPGGLQVWLAERRDLPLVEASLVLQCGAGTDFRGLSGLAALTADVLDTGTSKRDAIALSSALERLGSTLRARAGYDGSSVSLTSLPRHARESIGILAEIVAEPAFPDREVERLRGQRLSGILQQKDRPATVASLLLQRTLYGIDHPYGSDIGGTEKSVRSISREDLVRFWRTYYRPSGAVLLVSGPLGMTELEEIASPLAEHWTGTEPATELPEPHRGAGGFTP